MTEVMPRTPQDSEIKTLKELIQSVHGDIEELNNLVKAFETYTLYALSERSKMIRRLERALRDVEGQ
jgi:heme oxygenase